MFWKDLLNEGQKKCKDDCQVTKTSNRLYTHICKCPNQQLGGSSQMCNLRGASRITHLAGYTKRRGLTNMSLHITGYLYGGMCF